MSTQTSVWGTALALAPKGVCVFPTRPGSKRKQYLKSWPAGATTDRATILEWARRWPDANLAIHVGRSRYHGRELIVFDLDRHPGAPNGLESWVKMGTEYPELRNLDTARTITPSNGIHMYFTLPPGCDVTNLRGKLAPGIDVQKGTHYVMCPPSTFQGRAYQWEPGGRIAELPPRLQELLTVPKYTPRARATAGTYTATTDITMAERNLGRLSSARCDDYLDWVKVGISLSELGAVGLTLWDTWSQQSGQYEQDACADRWKDFNATGGLTLATLGYWANQDDPRPAPRGSR